MSISNPAPSVASLPRPLRTDGEITSLALSVHLLFASRPSLMDVARTTLREILAEHDPALAPAAATAVILEPQWRLEGGQPHKVGYNTHELTEVLLERCRGVGVRTFSQGSFLAKFPGAETPQGEKVPLGELQQMLDESASLLIESYQQHLVDFWSTGTPSVWRQLSDLFKAQLQQAASALMGEEHATVQAVLDYPEQGLRQQAKGQGTTRAYVTFVYEGDSDVPHAEDVLVLAMTRQMNGREVALLYTLSGGIEVFGSVAAMEASWFGARRAADSKLRNYTPEQDIFDALTLCLLERQLQLLAGIKPSVYPDTASLEREVAQVSSPSTLLGAFRSGHEARLSTFQDVLPAWLKSAPLADRSAYSRLLSSLAAQHRRQASFMTGIPSILEFAGQALKEKMLEDDPARSDISVSEIEVTLSRVSNSSFEIVDPPFPPRRSEAQTRTFSEMAIKNLGAFPRVQSKITYQGGNPPAWMTYEYLRDLTSRADIGQHYPELLRRKLLDDPLDSARRQQAFGDRLGILLPLLALELKIKKSLTDQAYRSVVAVFQPRAFIDFAAGHEPVVRPLAFLTEANATPDVVGNMFVIGPRDAGHGPHVLYRPASSAPLMEFASRAALFDAIKDVGALQGSVLAGLGPSARRIYANGGFQEPHIGRVLLSDVTSPRTPEPALLGTELIQGDIAGALYKACAQALIEQAKRASVSDSQARWDSFTQFGWVAFNLLLPLLEGPVVMIGLLAQLTERLDEFVDSEGVENTGEALAEVLMSLALVLVHGGSRRGAISRLEERPVTEAEAPVVPPGNAIIKEPASSASANPYGAKARLVYGWSSPRARFCAPELTSLDTFKLAAPSTLQGLVVSGEYQGLYRRGSLWFAQVEGQWYRVSRRLEGVVIIDAAHPARTGPWLEQDGQGRWSLGHSPRLLGGAGGLSVRAAKKLKSLEKKGRDLLGTLDQQMSDAGWLSRSERPPIDVEDLIVGKATEFERCAEEIEQLTQALGDQAPRMLIKDLRAGARRLRELGRTTRIAMTKAKLPNVGAVEYLLQEQEISIRKAGGRVDISDNKGNDFLQVYEIRERRNNRVLWFAHFHYLKQDAAADAFTKAHLKTYEQGGRGLEFQKAQQKAGQAVERIWRADIGSAAAKALFLSV
ncbi:dermonecrotic toxin domain-containing protein [Pseudomonas uvaldensis]|uniref:dermonecrotic toxin domain-containing protein n=1 Tax=Pseudomonas uvaldensis TaxID=2878385 RepID=UPI001E566BD6|nr:DUF6543 domain-containing protein [Pseudomonas uvaldensis]MCE0462711.1 hypothetical protein [Pseudomonas uvaldensis]